MSSVSSLQAELHHLQSINNELHRELNELAAGVSSAAREMSQFEDHVQGSLSDSANRIGNSHESIIRSYEMMEEIDQLYLRFKNMELANKKIRACNNKKYYDFANFTIVRKIVQGMLDNLNVNMVSDQVIYKSIEKKHLQNPDYWLTCVLLSVMAWRNDDKQLAERAMERALELDEKQSIVFYMLFNLRMSRNEAALKWFMEYQHCELKGSDQTTFLMLFSLLSKTIRDNVDDTIKFEVLDYINRVLAMNAALESFDEQFTLKRIENFFIAKAVSEELSQNTLKRCCGDYPELKRLTALAKNNINLLQMVLDIGNVSESERNEYLSKFIEEQISIPSQVEQDLYDEIAYNELIISNNGDTAKADQIFQEKTSHRERELNLVLEMVDWIYDSNSGGDVNPQSRKNMFLLTLELQKRAYLQYVEGYRSGIKSTHPVTLGDYSTEVDFSSRDGENQKIVEYYSQQRDEQLAQIKNTAAIVCAVIALAGIAGVFALGPVTLMVTLLGAASAGLYLFYNANKRKQLTKECQTSIDQKNRQMDEVFQEYDSWLRQFQEYDEYSQKVLDELDRI